MSNQDSTQQSPKSRKSPKGTNKKQNSSSSEFQLPMRLLRRAEIAQTLDTVLGPLHKAAKIDATEDLSALLSLGGRQADELDCAQQTALHYAASRPGGLECIQILVQNNADVNAKDVWYGTPLHNAVRAGHVKNAQFLLEQGRIDVNAQNLRRWTPLHIAVALGHLEMVKVLMQHDADLTLANEDAITPLVLAKQKRATDIMNYLLEVSFANQN